MKDHPDMWRRADALLEVSKLLVTRFFAEIPPVYQQAVQNLLLLLIHTQATIIPLSEDLKKGYQEGSD
eukprot:scaffold8120_cov178-Ochromonas_danica.AAC.3